MLAPEQREREGLSVREGEPAVRVGTTTTQHTNAASRGLTTAKWALLLGMTTNAGQRRGKIFA